MTLATSGQDVPQTRAERACDGHGAAGRSHRRRAGRGVGADLVLRCAHRGPDPGFPFPRRAEPFHMASRIAWAPIAELRWKIEVHEALAARSPIQTSTATTLTIRAVGIV